MDRNYVFLFTFVTFRIYKIASHEVLNLNENTIDSIKFSLEDSLDDFAHDRFSSTTNGNSSHLNELNV